MIEIQVEISEDKVLLNGMECRQGWTDEDVAIMTAGIQDEIDKTVYEEIYDKGKNKK